jgi:CubicO group peptidase (beta-lactamase class C family)
LIEQSIDRNAGAFLKNKEINSVSIGIIKDGETFIGHFGELEKGKGNPPTNSSVYEIASVTKTMTGYLMAQAILDEKVRLDDDIRNYLDGDYSNLEFESQPITFRHLLTHTSSLPKYLPLEMNGVFKKLTETVPQDYYEFEAHFNKDDFLSDLKKVKLAYTPGTEYEYSNAGAEIVGYILETIYEKNIDAILKEAFLDERGMINTSMKLKEEQKEHLVQGYWMKNDQLSPRQLNSFWGTGAGIKSTVPDLLKYMEMQLDGTNLAAVKSHEELFTKGKTAKVGYFWNLWTDKYGPSFNHHGGTSGTQNWMFLFPRHQLGIIVLTNHSGPKTPGKLRKVVNRILKDILPKV